MELEKMRELEQAMHTHSVQMQSLQAEAGEIENALAELETSEDAYRIIGNLMVRTTPEKLRAQLNTRKDLIGKRMDAVKRQGDSLQERMEEMKSTILGDENE